MRVKFIKKKKEADFIYSFFFEKPSDFLFAPGKFIYLTLPRLKQQDRRGDTRHFSISSSPSENFLQTAVKKGVSGFKKSLFSLQKGATVEIDGPHGIYEWPIYPLHHHIFVCGGVGITPMRSRLKYNMENKLETKITLLQSSSFKNEIPFQKELSLFEKYPFFTVKRIVTKKNQGKRINLDLLKAQIANPKKSIVWICGRDSFVDDMEKLALKAKVPAKNILTEKFTGY